MLDTKSEDDCKITDDILEAALAPMRDKQTIRFPTPKEGEGQHYVDRQVNRVWKIAPSLSENPKAVEKLKLLGKLNAKKMDKMKVSLKTNRDFSIHPQFRDDDRKDWEIVPDQSFVNFSEKEMAEKISEELGPGILIKRKYERKK